MNLPAQQSAHVWAWRRHLGLMGPFRPAIWWIEGCYKFGNYYVKDTGR